MSGVGSRTISGRPAVLLDLVVDGGLRPEVRDGRGHDDDIRRRRAGQDGGLHLGGSLDRDDLGARGHRPADGRDDVTDAPRAAASKASACPCLPDDRFAITRTASIGSRVPPAVTSTRSPAMSFGASSRWIALDDRLGAREPPGPDVAARETSGLGVDDAHAAPPQGREVLLHRRVLPHLGVHRWAHDDGRPRGDHDGSEEVVPTGRPRTRRGSEPSRER